MRSTSSNVTENCCSVRVRFEFRAIFALHLQVFNTEKHPVARVSIPAFVVIFHWAIAVVFVMIEVDLFCDRMIVPVTAILYKASNRGFEFCAFVLCTNILYICNPFQWPTRVRRSGKSRRRRRGRSVTAVMKSHLRRPRRRP